MNKITTIFLDDGGVMNDNSRRPEQWQRLIGEYCVPRLGGTMEQWAAANWEFVSNNLDDTAQRALDTLQRFKQIIHFDLSKRGVV